MRNSKDIRNLFQLTLGFLFTLLMFAFVPGVSGQGEASNTDMSPDESLKSPTRVNPSTLAMEMSIPLGVYPGRAGNSVSNSFSYSSKVWQFRNLSDFSSPISGYGITVAPLFARGSAAGWTSSLGVPRIDYPYENSFYLGADSGSEGQVWTNFESEGNYNIFYIKRLYVTLPDGSSREFRASDTPIQCGTTQGTQCSNNPDLTGIFLSVDGTKMRLEVTTNDAILFMPDGSRILFGGMQSEGRLATAIVDVNGNKTIYNSTTKQWTDTMGRSFPNFLPTNNDGSFTQYQTVGDQVLSLPGMNSGTIQTTLSWRYL
jgi:hypothetical protein